MAIFGKSGVGKSTLLRNMIAWDIAHGAGVAVEDPHGILSALPVAKRAEVKHDVNDALLRSYKNGLDAAKSGAARPRGQWRGKGATRS